MAAEIAWLKTQIGEDEEDSGEESDEEEEEEEESKAADAVKGDGEHCNDNGGGKECVMVPKGKATEKTKQKEAAGIGSEEKLRGGKGGRGEEEASESESCESESDGVSVAGLILCFVVEDLV